jgi:hypothetical protein
MKVTHVVLVLSAWLLTGGIANASGTIIVPADPAGGPSGSTFTVPGLIANTYVLSLTVSGTPFLQNASGETTNTGTPLYGTNGAGVVTVAGETGFPVGSGLFDNTNHFEYGSLLLSLNGGTPVQVFPTTAANGLGATTPPTVLSFNMPLSSLFGNFSAMTNPTLTFKVYDTDYRNNSGSFSVALGPNNTLVAVASSADAPVPGWALALLGAVLLGMVTRGPRNANGARASG